MTSTEHIITHLTANCTDADAIWAVDAYAARQKDYQAVFNAMSSQQPTRGYQLGKTSDVTRRKFAEIFASDPESDQVSVIFCPSGTSANNVLRSAVLDHHKAMVVYDTIAHSVDRSGGSVESLTGSRTLKPVDFLTLEEMNQLDASRAFITPDLLDKAITRRNSDYFITQKPALLSISVPSENGTVVSLDYLRELSQVAQKHEMLFHIDGARLFIAAAFHNVTLKEITTDCGVDMVSLGGGKVGMVAVDAAVFTPNFFKKCGILHTYKNSTESFSRFRSIAKRHGALVGPSEAMIAQFYRALTDDFGIHVGRHYHQAALDFASRVTELPTVRLAQPVESNVVMLEMSKFMLEHVLKKYTRLKTVPAASDENIIVRFMAHHDIDDTIINETVTYLAEWSPC